MADENVFNELEAKENEAMVIQLEAAVSRTAITIEEYIAMRQLGGATGQDILAELLDDLNNNGRIFGEFKNAVKATAHGNLKRVADIGRYTENGIAIEYIWLTVQDGHKICPSCRPRHGVKKTWAEWGKVGRPREGGTICRQHCKCDIYAPDEVAKIPELPINHKRRKK